MDEDGGEPRFRDFTVKKKAWATDGYVLQDPDSSENDSEKREMGMKDVMEKSRSSLQKFDFKRSKKVASSLIDSAAATAMIPFVIMWMAFLLAMIAGADFGMGEEGPGGPREYFAGATLFLLLCIKWGRYGSKMKVIPDGAMVLSRKWGFFSKEIAFTDHPNLIAVNTKESKRKFDVFVWAEHEPFPLVYGIRKSKVKQMKKIANKKTDLEVTWIERDLDLTGMMRVIRFWMVGSIAIAVTIAFLLGQHTGEFTGRDLSDMIGSIVAPFILGETTSLDYPWYIENITFILLFIVISPFIVRSFLGWKNLALETQEIFLLCEEKFGNPLARKVSQKSEGKSSEANGGEPKMGLRRLLAGIFSNPIGRQFGIVIIAVAIGLILNQVG